jgi:hypothetical protein
MSTPTQIRGLSDLPWAMRGCRISRRRGQPTNFECDKYPYDRFRPIAVIGRRTIVCLVDVRVNPREIDRLRPLGAVLIAAISMFLGSCSLFTDSPDECWSTELLRLKVGSAVYDIPAELRPTPEPSHMPGLLTPSFEPGIDTGKARLMWCQDREHVPLEVNSFTLKQAETSPSLQAVLQIGVDAFASPRRGGRHNLPDARRVREWVITQTTDGRDTTHYELTGPGDTRATLSCQHIQVVNTDRVTALCRTDVAVGDFAEMFVAFTGDGMTPAQYLEVLQAAALLIEDLHVRANRSGPDA